MDGLVRAAIRVGVVVCSIGCFQACGGPQEPAEEGADCYRDTDCAFGLVCVPSSSGARTCSKNVSGLVDQVEGPPPPPDAGMPTDGAAPPPADGG